MVNDASLDYPEQESESFQTSWPKCMHVRLTDCMDGLKNSYVATATGVSSESVRRYRNGSLPPLEFVCAVSELTGTSLLWLLTGEGPRKTSDLTMWYLSRSSLTELTSELGRRIHLIHSRIQLVQDVSSDRSESRTTAGSSH